MFEKIIKNCKESKKFKRDMILTLLVALVLFIVILNHVFFNDNMYVMLGGVLACGIFYLWLAKILFKAFVDEKINKKK